jgi:hypothetical protein
LTVWSVAVAFDDDDDDDVEEYFADATISWLELGP